VQFNAQGLQTSVTDRNGNATTYAYDPQIRLTTITDPVSQVTTFAYSGSVLSTITDPAGRVTQLSHDSAGNLTGMTYGDTYHSVRV
jgi:YD repeat-containing protein